MMIVLSLIELNCHLHETSIDVASNLLPEPTEEGSYCLKDRTWK